MKPSKIGQIVKFHTPLEDEDPDQQYVILEISLDEDKSRAEIKALNTGLKFPSINTVLVKDLEVIEVSTNDLIGHNVTIQKADYSEVNGKVLKVSVQKINLDLSNGIKGVETNVWLTIEDRNGSQHNGFLVVYPNS